MQALWDSKYRAHFVPSWWSDYKAGTFYLFFVFWESCNVLSQFDNGISFCGSEKKLKISWEIDLFTRDEAILYPPTYYY
jgi:hypothetical protein